MGWGVVVVEGLEVDVGPGWVAEGEGFYYLGCGVGFGGGCALGVGGFLFFVFVLALGWGVGVCGGSWWTCCRRVHGFCGHFRWVVLV